MAETEQADRGGLAVQHRQSMGGKKPPAKNNAALRLKPARNSKEAE